MVQDRRRNLLLAVLLVCSGVTNLVLGWYVRELRKPPPPAVGYLTAGVVAPPLSLERLDGSPFTIDFKNVQEGTLLYVFSPTCPACIQNRPNIDALAAGLHPGLKIVGISLVRDGLVAYLEANPVAFETLVATPGALAAYKLRAVPELFHIDRSGVVVQSWRGAFTGLKKSEIEESFGVVMPGLKKATVTTQSEGAK